MSSFDETKKELLFEVTAIIKKYGESFQNNNDVDSAMPYSVLCEKCAKEVLNKVNEIAMLVKRP